MPFFIRHPEGKLAGQWDDFYASNHDIAKTALSFMGVRPPGMMTGEDLSVIFDGKRPPPRPHFTSCYDDYVLAGDDDWFFLTDSSRFRPQLYDQKKDPQQEHNVADQHPRRRREVLAHPVRRGRRHAAAVQPPRRRSRCSADEPHPPQPCLRRGGATAAGAGVLGVAQPRAAPAAAKLGDDRARGVVVVVLPLVRAEPRGRLRGRRAARRRRT